MLEQEGIILIEADVGLTRDIRSEEVKAALCMIGRKKAVGLDEVSIEAWQYLAESGIR